jgi:hypothetical protein
MKALRVIVLFALVATAAAADASTLRGHHHHKHAHSASDSAAVPMRFRAAAQLKDPAAPAAPAAGAPAPVHVVPASHASTDNVAREGLGENVPYKGIDCKFSLLLHPVDTPPPHLHPSCRNKRTATRSCTARPATLARSAQSVRTPRSKQNAAPHNNHPRPLPIYYHLSRPAVLPLSRTTTHPPVAPTPTLAPTPLLPRRQCYCA